MSKTRNRTYCCVFGCTNNNSSIPDLSLFSVPNDPVRRLVWLKLIGREDIFEASYAYRVCEEHFKPGEILMKSTRKILKRNAVPSLNLPATETPEDQESPEELLEVSMKEEIEDAFSEHEDDIMEQLEKRKRMNQTPPHVPTKIMKVEPSDILTVDVERESEHKLIQFPVDFMKTVLNSQDEILTVLKSQVLLQDPDADLIKFLRLVGAKLQRLSLAKRREVQNAVVELINSCCYNVKL